MQLELLVTFSIIASLLVMSPGPNGVLIVSTMASSGRMAAFGNVLGFVAAFFLHGTFSLLGVSVVLMNSALAFAVIKYVGALYLCWIGIGALYAAWKGECAAAPKESKKEKKHSLRRAIGEGFLTNALNPKVSMFYLAAFPQFAMTDSFSDGGAFVLVGVHALVAALWFSGLIWLLGSLGKAARATYFQRGIKLLTGIVFIGFGLKMITLRASG
ncbi:LysE family translocator [Polycladidibacter hongkongensis]|uniref:LysE family translocator n=1 Tax=Polycladidibacter hongkongensis TaxID=1647556 RepID=UPI000836E6C2|nr:LysE family translocator [Pseudovibrio hongkongensis]